MPRVDFLYFADDVPSRFITQKILYALNGSPPLSIEDIAALYPEKYSIRWLFQGLRDKEVFGKAEYLRIVRCMPLSLPIRADLETYTDDIAQGWAVIEDAEDFLEKCDEVQ